MSSVISYSLRLHLIRGIFRTMRANTRSCCVGARRYQCSKIDHLADQTKSQISEPSFASLYENSKFARLLDPVGQKVKGKVVAVVGDNLYVDFGCKFHAVVKRPEEQRAHYTEGTSVILLVKDLEMTMHPLGASRDLSLLEAEAELCGLA